MSSLEAELKSKLDLTPDVKIFRFEVEKKVDFEPGDHVTLTLIDEEEISRPYNMINQPEGNQLLFAIRKYEGGKMSPKLHKLEEGENVEVSEPGGSLKIASYEKDAVFISTGTGATPMFDMLRDYLKNGDGKPYYFYGEKTKKDILFKDQLEILKAENEELELHYSISDDENWKGRTGHIQNYVPRELESMEDKVFYICGVPAMVVQTQSLLKGAGVKEENIVTEGWEEGEV